MIINITIILYNNYNNIKLCTYVQVRYVVNQIGLISCVMVNIYSQHAHMECPKFPGIYTYINILFQKDLYIYKGEHICYNHRAREKFLSSSMVITYIYVYIKTGYVAQLAKA